MLHCLTPVQTAPRSKGVTLPIYHIFQQSVECKRHHLLLKKLNVLDLDSDENAECVLDYALCGKSIKVAIIIAFRESCWLTTNL